MLAAMAEAYVALCFSSFSSPFCISRSLDLSPTFVLHPFVSSPRFSVSHHSPSHLLRFSVKSSGSGSFMGNDSFGLFPWTDGDSEIHWVPEERITLFHPDGLVQIGGSIVPRRISSSDVLDMGRRLCIYGFCRSVEMLSDVVEDIVLEQGGEVVAAEKASGGRLQEKLTMTVAVPLLWGVPPASETLHLAVQSGGGIVQKVYWQWDFV